MVSLALLSEEIGFIINASFNEQKIINDYSINFVCSQEIILQCVYKDTNIKFVSIWLSPSLILHHPGSHFFEKYFNGDINTRNANVTKVIICLIGINSLCTFGKDIFLLSVNQRVTGIEYQCSKDNGAPGLSGNTFPVEYLGILQAKIGSSM